MIRKLIRATVKPGCREAFLARQRHWNAVMARQPGFVSVGVATDPTDPAVVTILIAMRSRADLDRFMHGEHDATHAATRMDEVYDHLEVAVLDVVEDMTEAPGTPPNPCPS